MSADTRELERRLARIEREVSQMIIWANRIEILIAGIKAKEGHLS
jgi:hypothetical protein